MGRRKRRELFLDALVGLTAVVALTFLVRERLVPWMAERAVLDPGEIVEESPDLVDATSGDSVRWGGGPQLLLVFRSSCPACERALPGWNRLAAGGAWRTTAVGLEAPATAAIYAGARLAADRVAVPRDIERFTTRFRIRVVPTTLVIDHEGRLAARRAGPLEERDLAALRRLAASSTP